MKVKRTTTEEIVIYHKFGTLYSNSRSDKVEISLCSGRLLRVNKDEVLSLKESLEEVIKYI